MRPELNMLSDNSLMLTDCAKNYAHKFNEIVLEMCSVSTNGERVSPAQGSQLIGCHFSYLPQLIRMPIYLLNLYLNIKNWLISVLFMKCIPILPNSCSSQAQTIWKLTIPMNH